MADIVSRDGGKTYEFFDDDTGTWRPWYEYDPSGRLEAIQTGGAPVPMGGAPSMPAFGGNSQYSAMPGYGNSSSPDGMMEGDKGWWDSATDWLGSKLGGISGADWLSAAGAGVGAYLDYQQGERNRGLSEAQFNRIQAQREAQQAVEAETRLNRAPLADKSQAILLARMGAAPETFAPRDITKGTDSFRRAATGGPGNVTRAYQDAAQSYTPGSGGVRTKTLEAYLDKMRRSSGLS